MEGGAKHARTFGNAIAAKVTVEKPKSKLKQQKKYKHTVYEGPEDFYFPQR